MLSDLSVLACSPADGAMNLPAQSVTSSLLGALPGWISFFFALSVPEIPALMSKSNKISN